MGLYWVICVKQIYINNLTMYWKTKYNYFSSVLFLSSQKKIHFIICIYKPLVIGVMNLFIFQWSLPPDYSKWVYLQQQFPISRIIKVQV